MVKAYQNYFKHLGNFSGTASRREFWWPWLLNVIVGYVIMTILFLDCIIKVTTQKM
ncbi:hypothetical protein LPL9_2434 [Lacticaseibacillus paracasei]|jgi:uncharacterized membrane protein YhaH (DUF805 family)|uniref:DUF805 domain-containing protein n=1 Tax=Lacticaseibacillus paracasei TaxID=1597 RepID=UPI000343C0DD|nr:hypothetical protein LPL9_2434 [Lacticaseibacillus paracasei]EPC81132.1 Inner membrane protein yhaI [Lacticaseibacillus paracasei subsp. paracasei CNCM I-4649]